MANRKIPFSSQIKAIWKLVEKLKKRENSPENWRWEGEMRLKNVSLDVNEADKEKQQTLTNYVINSIFSTLFTQPLLFIDKRNIVSLNRVWKHFITSLFRRCCIISSLRSINVFFSRRFETDRKCLTRNFLFSPILHRNSVERKIGNRMFTTHKIQSFVECFLPSVRKLFIKSTSSQFKNL